MMWSVDEHDPMMSFARRATAEVCPVDGGIAAFGSDVRAIAARLPLQAPALPTNPPSPL
jgi:hypothetical protein